jgi:D-serine deaminase-like pyridoxal phosphate-dependent protein
VPNHACVTANMHDEVVVLRNGDVVETLPIPARGKVR